MKPRGRVRRVQRAQPRDHRGRYARRPQPPIWGPLVIFALIVILVILPNL